MNINSKYLYFTFEEGMLFLYFKEIAPIKDYIFIHAIELHTFDDCCLTEIIYSASEKRAAKQISLVSRTCRILVLSHDVIAYS